MEQVITWGGTKMDFVSFTEYQEIINCIQQGKYFEHRCEIKKIEISIHSSIAQCDWTNSDVKDGDYLVHISMFKHYGNYLGQGSPYSVEEFLREFGSYELLVRHVNEWIVKNSNTVKIGLSEQLSLF